MIDLSDATLGAIWAELRKRNCAVIIVAPDALKDLHPNDAEEIAWAAIDRALDNQDDDE